MWSLAPAASAGADPRAADPPNIPIQKYGGVCEKITPKTRSVTNCARLHMIPWGILFERSGVCELKYMTKIGVARGDKLHYYMECQ